MHRQYHINQHTERSHPITRSSCAAPVCCALGRTVAHVPPPAIARLTRAVPALVLRATPPALVAPALAKNNKRGLAYSDKTPLDDIKAATVDNGAASWVYTWQTLPADQIKNSGLEFVPMQHDRNGLADLSANLNGLGAKIVLVRCLH